MNLFESLRQNIVFTEKIIHYNELIFLCFQIILEKLTDWFLARKYKHNRVEHDKQAELDKQKIFLINQLQIRKM